MPLRKTAIAISEELLAAIDRAAKDRRETRNRFMTRVLEQAVRARRDADITRRLNDLFADADLDAAQKKETAALGTAGVDWTEKGW